MRSRATEPSYPEVTVIGAGLAGSEAAWQLAERGLPVRLVEMRPTRTGPAHHTAYCAELVCSNSFRSDDPLTASGMLKRELETMGSLVMTVARRHAVAAGGALAVDRDAFSAEITDRLLAHPHVRIERDEAEAIPENGRVIIATGPLTSDAFASALTVLVGDRLAFFDAAAPIVSADSIDMRFAFAASRYGKGGGDDYLNCPLTRGEYDRFVEALLGAQRVMMHDFETRDLFQACQPAEEIARRGPDALRYGPMKPVGLTDPRTGSRPWAVVQLRAENAHHTAYNIVGFQTNLTFAEQRRVLGLIPGLEHASFERYGVMHRNTFVDAPRLLTPTLALRQDPRIRLAGQITGTEGYLEAAGTGLLAALGVAAEARQARLPGLAPVTALGALVAHATDPATQEYQPMHVNLGVMPPLDPPVKSKDARRRAYLERARAALELWMDEQAHLFEPGTRPGHASFNSESAVRS